jgi:hypothetical protein
MQTLGPAPIAALWARDWCRFGDRVHKELNIKSLIDKNPNLGKQIRQRGGVVAIWRDEFPDEATTLCDRYGYPWQNLRSVSDRRLRQRPASWSAGAQPAPAASAPAAPPQAAPASDQVLSPRSEIGSEWAARTASPRSDVYEYRHLAAERQANRNADSGSSQGNASNEVRPEPQDTHVSEFGGGLKMSVMKRSRPSSSEASYTYTSDNSSSNSGENGHATASETIADLPPAGTYLGATPKSKPKAQVRSRSLSF